MRSLIFIWALFGLSLFLGPISCTNQPVREVSSISNLNPEKVRTLRQAAEAGVLFVVGDAVFRDQPTKEVGSCRKSEESPWAENLFGLLEAFAQSPALYNKVNMIEIRRGDEAKTSLEREVDGSVRLVVAYARRTTYEKINPFTELPCETVGNQYVNSDLKLTNYEWPTKDNIVATLAAAEDKPLVPRFNFDRKFLVYLADRLTILRAHADVISDKNANDEFSLVSIMNKLSREVSGSGNFKNIDFWLGEISLHSKLASSLGFFGLSKDFLISYGVKVDSAGKMSRKINNSADTTYVHISYRAEAGLFESATLKELNICLEKLTNIYRSPAFVKTFETDKEAYLYPGFPCLTNAEK